MARKEDKQPQYLPLIVKAKLHTGGRDYEKIKEELKGQGFTCKQMKGMVREGNYFDGIVLYLSKWNWDNHESWHLYNWDDKDDKEVMLGIYEAEQYHPQAPYRYRDNFEKFQKDWTSGEYDPGMTFTFKDSEVEVLEVLQEEVDNIDHEAVKRQVAAAEDAQYQKRRKQSDANRQARAADTIESSFDGGIKMAKKKRKYYSGKELLYRRQLERQQAEEEEKTNNIRIRQLHQINASSRAIGWAKQKMREGKNNDCISD